MNRKTIAVLGVDVAYIAFIAQSYNKDRGLSTPEIIVGLVLAYVASIHLFIVQRQRAVLQDRRAGRCSVVLFVGILMFVLMSSLFVSYFALFQFQQGRETVAFYSCEVRRQLIQTTERGTLWKAAATALQVGVELPMFVVGSGGERLKFFELYREVCGEHFPFQDGVAITSHEEVSAILSAPQQKGRYLGAQKAPEPCMGAKTLIFQSNGEAHDRMKKFLLEAIEAFHPGPGEPIPYKVPTSIQNPSHASDSEVASALVYNMYRRFFGVFPSDSELATLVEYFAVGGTCVLGENFHKLTAYFQSVPFLESITEIRESVLGFVSKTPVGQHVLDAYKKEFQVEGAQGDLEAQETLMQVVDGFMFAGMFGSRHLTLGVLNRIRSSPVEFLRFWNDDARAFILEQSRVDPPVTSVTVLMGDGGEEVLMGKSNQHKISFPAGATKQVIISTANIDPKVFGGEEQSRLRAKKFDPTRPKEELDKILTFNGVEAQVVARVSPRGCLGHDVALRMVQETVNAFLPSAHHVFLSQLEDKPQGTEEFDDWIENYYSSRDHYVWAWQVNDNILDSVGYAFWGLCSLLGLIYLRNQPGSIAGLYRLYLLGQFWVSFGYICIYVRLPIYYLGQILAAFAYYTIFLVAHGISVDRPWTIDFGIIVSLIQSAWIVFLVYYFSFSFPLWALQAICFIFYAPGALFAMSVLVSTYKTNTDRRLSNKLFYGVLGGIFGSLNPFWPHWVAPNFLFHILSRVSDGLLYVPLVLPAIIAIDRKHFAQPGGAPNPQEKPAAVCFCGHARLRWLSITGIVFLLFVVTLLTTGGTHFLFSRVADGNICPFLDPKNLTAEQNLACTQGTELVSKLDLHTLFMFKMLKWQHEGFRADPWWDPKNSAIVSEPWFQGKLLKEHVHFGVTAPKHDPEDSGLVGLAGQIQGRISAGIEWYLVALPLEDKDVEWESLTQARDTIALTAGKDIPHSLIPWERYNDVSSDEVVSMIAFAGLASHRLIKITSDNFLQLPEHLQVLAKKFNTVYISDWSWMYGLKVREGFEPYGATAFFGESTELFGIWWPHGNKTVLPGEKEWVHVKWVWRCSVVTGATLRDHLIGTHMMLANFIATSVAENLPSVHPMRRFLRPFTYRTLSINKGAIAHLCSHNGLLHRSVALSWEGLKTGMKYSYSTLRYAPVRDILKSSGLTSPADKALVPWVEDMSDFVAIVTRYVSGYLDLYYQTDADVTNDASLVKFLQQLHSVRDSQIPRITSKKDLVDLLVNFVTYVTAVHNHVGNVAAYLLDPRLASAKIRPGREISDVQASLQAMNIGLLSGWKVPLLLNDFSHTLLKDEKNSETKKLMSEFQAGLVQLSKTIDERNERRKWPSNSVNPSQMQSSVSV